MDITLNSEQEMLRESARRFIEAECQLSHARVQDSDIEQANWEKLVALGWTCLAVPEEAGGLSGSLEDIAILFMEIGRGLLKQPLLGGAILTSRILARCQGESAHDILGRIAAGEANFTTALYDRDCQYELRDIGTRAIRQDNGFVVTGSKILAAGGAVVDHLLFTAQLEATDQSEGGLAIFVTPLDTTSISRHDYELFDGSRACDFELDSLYLSAEALVAGPFEDPTLIEMALNELLVALCAETIGATEHAIQLTADYLKIREQFNTPLAEFQALQHQLADMFIAATHAKSSLYQAISSVAGQEPLASKVLSGSVLNIMSTAKKVIGTAIHLHGGIGFTCEHIVGHLYRRTLVNEKLYGNSTFHLSRYKALSELATDALDNN